MRYLGVGESWIDQARRAAVLGWSTKSDVPASRAGGWDEVPRVLSTDCGEELGRQRQRHKSLGINFIFLLVLLLLNYLTNPLAYEESTVESHTMSGTTSQLNWEASNNSRPHVSSQLPPEVVICLKNARFVCHVFRLEYALSLRLLTVSASLGNMP